jgi:hypothetical protein
MNSWEKREDDWLGENQPSTTRDWNRRALMVLGLLALVAVATFVAVMLLDS